MSSSASTDLSAKLAVHAVIAGVAHPPLQPVLRPVHGEVAAEVHPLCASALAAHAELIPSLGKGGGNGDGEECGSAERHLAAVSPVRLASSKQQSYHRETLAEK